MNGFDSQVSRYILSSLGTISSSNRGGTNPTRSSCTQKGTMPNETVQVEAIVGVKSVGTAKQRLVKCVGEKKLMIVNKGVILNDCGPKSYKAWMRNQKKSKSRGDGAEDNLDDFDTTCYVCDEVPDEDE